LASIRPVGPAPTIKTSVSTESSGGLRPRLIDGGIVGTRDLFIGYLFTTSPAGAPQLRKTEVSYRRDFGKSSVQLRAEYIDNSGIRGSPRNPDLSAKLSSSMEPRICRE
jgi:hypothetical protein